MGTLRNTYPHASRAGLLIAAVLFSPFCHNLKAAQNEAIRTALTPYGYRTVALSRPSSERLTVAVNLNGKPAQLAIDTGAPISYLDRAAAEKFGVRSRQSNMPVRGVLGPAAEHYEFTNNAYSIELAGIVMPDITFAVFNEPFLTARKGPVPGVLGAASLNRLAAVIDCGNARMYLNPNGQRPRAAETLNALLAARGFTRVPIQVNERHHFQVPCEVNGYKTALTVDLLGGLTTIQTQVAAAAHIPMVSTRSQARAVGGTVAPLNAAQVQALRIGSFLIPNAKISTHNGDFGVLGLDYLTNYSGVIDLGGKGLYLRGRSAPPRH
jgi:predicted aspartyl protease